MLPRELIDLYNFQVKFFIRVSLRWTLHQREHKHACASAVSGCAHRCMHARTPDCRSDTCMHTYMHIAELTHTCGSFGKLSHVRILRVPFLPQQLPTRKSWTEHFPSVYGNQNRFELFMLNKSGSVFLMFITLKIHYSMSPTGKMYFWRTASCRFIQINKKKI